MERDRDALRTYLAVFAWLLLVAALMPIDFHGSRDPVWPWEGLLDAHWADVLAILLPFAGGILFLIVSRTRWTRTTLAFSVLASFGIAWLVHNLSLLMAYPLGVYDNLSTGLPALFARALWLILLGIVLITAGVRLGGKGFLAVVEGQPRPADPARASIALIAVGFLLILLFYFLPYRGSVPLFRLVEGATKLSGHLDTKMGFVLFLNQMLALGPLLLALAAAVRLFRRAPGRGGFLVALLVAFLPLLVLLVGLRNLLVAPAYAILNFRAALTLLTITVGGSLALGVLIRGLWYHIPWSFGVLGKRDERLVFALTQKDPGSALKKLLDEAHPLVRPFVRRRLALWRAAAQQVITDEQDLEPRLAAWLGDRWKEENAPAPGLPGDEPSSDVPNPRGAWPGWMAGHRLSAIAGSAVVIAVALTVLAAHRPSAPLAWRTDQDSEVLARIFEDELPSVISEMGYREFPVAQLDSFAALDVLLTEAEADCSGIRDGVVSLLELGREGRHRLHRIQRARDDLNTLLQDNHVPYFVRSRVRLREGGDLFYLLIYRVADYRRYTQRGDDRPYLVLHLVRADRLNVLESHMGFAEEEEEYVFVIFDRLGEFIQEALLPLLEQEGELGELARRGLAGAKIPVDDLFGTAPLDELDEEDDEPAEQAAPESGKAGASEKLSAFVLDGLSRHELHHRWLGMSPEPPPALWTWLSEYSERSVRGVASELGAYLGECGADPAYARLKFAAMMETLDGYGASRNRHVLARTFLLSRLLDVDLEGAIRWAPMKVQMQADRLLAMSDDELTSKLGRLHREFFGTEIPIFRPATAP